MKALIESLSGIGNLYNQETLVARVNYMLSVIEDMPGGLKRIKGQIKVLRDVDKFWETPTGTLFTLHLIDKRKLHLYCSSRNFKSSICRVDGQNDFYS